MQLPTDDDIFNTPPGSDNALEPVETEQTGQAEQTAEPAEKEPPAQQQPAADDDGKSSIPSWRLKQEAESRRLAEERFKFEQERSAYLQQQLQQLQSANKPQQQAEQLDPYMDPQAYSQHMREQQVEFEQRLAGQLRLQQANVSFQIAEMRHGENFSKHWAEFQEVMRNPSSPYFQECNEAAQRILHSDNPGEAFMAVVRRHQVLNETGGDLDAYKKKVIEDLRKDPKFVEELIAGQQGAEAAAAPEAQPAEPRHETRLPPSLSKVAGSRQPKEMSDDDIFNTPPSRMR